MKRGRAKHLGVGVFCFWLIACAARPQAVSPTPIAPTAKAMHDRLEEAASPTGKFKFQKKCPPLNINGLCSYVFSNGQETPPFSAVWWSNDEAFIYICASPGSALQCGLTEIWNVRDGSLAANNLDLGAMLVPIVQWKSDENTVAFYDLQSNGPSLFLYDAAKQELSQASACPQWLLDSISRDDTPNLIENSSENWLQICADLLKLTTPPP